MWLLLFLAVAAGYRLAAGAALPDNSRRTQCAAHHIPLAAREDVALELDTDTEVSREIRSLSCGQGRPETMHKRVKPADRRLCTFSFVAFRSLSV